MCEFEKHFLLCSCSNDIKKEEIDWEIKRQSKNLGENSFKIIGQINIPDKFKNISKKEFDSKIDEMLNFSRLHDSRKIELKNTISNIEFELNDRNCFDKEFTFIENDILSIRLDNTFKVWADYIYQNYKWKISDLLISEYYQVNKGKIKANTQQRV